VSSEDVARQVIAKVGLWWPDADEGELRSAAGAWDALAASIDAATASGASGAGQASGAWEGKAAEKFAAFWGKYDGDCAAYLPATAQAARGLSQALNDYADAVADAKKRVEELAVEIGATLVVGTALAFFTFGVAEAAAAGVTAELIAAAATIGVELSTTVATIVGTALVGAAFGTVEAVAVDVAVAQPVRVFGYQEGGFSFDEVEKTAAFGAAGGLIFGGSAAALRAFRGVPQIESSEALLTELQANGVKVTPNDVVHIGRDGNGRILFLEQGDTRAGLQHVLNRHAKEFADQGIAQEDISSYVFRAATEGTPVGSQGDGRTIFEFTWNGETRRIAITVGDNGYIVGANPRGK
jgi:uncharacterized protein YukE